MGDPDIYASCIVRLASSKNVRNEKLYKIQIKFSNKK